MTSSFLDQMAAGSRERVQLAKRVISEAALLDRVRSLPPSPPLRRHPAGFDLIAELKLRSPAVGQLEAADEADIDRRVTTYAMAGAAAVSVLTEPSRFDGSLQHLQMAAPVLRPLNVPAMRKDFLIDPYQVIEARAAGAGGVLVILRMLDDAGVGALIDCARSLGLFVLLEAFDEADLERMHRVVDAYAARPGGACSAGEPSAVLLAGLNCRDLSTLQIVPEQLIARAHLLPTSVPRVAESGIGSADDARRVAAAGYDLVLVGSALMQGGDPGALASAMLEAGRAAARSR